MEVATRSADPWRDTDVVDEHAARVAQGTTGIVALLGVVFGWPLAWALMSAQLLIGVTPGGGSASLSRLLRRHSTQIRRRPARGLAAAAPGEHDRNRLSEGAGIWWLGAEPAGTALAALVAFLALISASTGFCVGCEVYRLQPAPWYLAAVTTASIPST